MNLKYFKSSKIGVQHNFYSALFHTILLRNFDSLSNLNPSFLSVLQLKEGRNQNELGINEEYEILQTEITHLQETNLVKEKNIEQHRSQVK